MNGISWILMLKSELQQSVMILINNHGKVNKEPIARKFIVEEMISRGFNQHKVTYSLKQLVKKRYLRRSVGTSNKTRYVQLKIVLQK